MTPLLSLRLTTPRISGSDGRADATTPAARANVPAPPSEPTRTDVRAAVEKLSATMREAVAAVSRSTALPSPETEVVMGRAIATGQARSLGAGVDKKLKNNPAFDDVHVGRLRINGQSLQVNPSRDNLAGVIASLNAFAGVSASLDSHSGLVTIIGDRPGQALQISDETGFLQALGIETGAVKPTVAVRRTGPNPVSVAAAVAVNEVVAGINGVLDTLTRARDVPSRVGFEVLTAVREVVGSVAGAPSAGIALTSASGQDRLEVDSAAISKVLAKDPHAFDLILSRSQSLPETVSALLGPHADPDAGAPPPTPRPGTVVLDGRRLMGTRSVIRDVSVELQLMRRFTAMSTTAHRFDVRV